MKPQPHPIKHQASSIQFQASSIKHPVSSILCFIVALITLNFSLIQCVSANEQFLFTSGTVLSNHAYIVWQATDETLLNNRTLALFRKDGAADSVNPFSLAGVVTLQTDPSSLTLLIEDAEPLGEDPIVLASLLDQMFGEVVPADTITLPNKLSAVIRGALEDDTLFDNLVFIAKDHPAVAMAIGRAFTTQIPAGKSTFEVREYDRSSGRAEQVLGRVTVETGNPVQLPAPTNLTEVEDDTPRGHLNTRLRWDTPDSLLRLSLLRFGYNIYRIPAFDAISFGYDVTPPTPAQLDNGLFTQVNGVPVLPNEDDTDPDSWFFVDDNDAFEDGGSAFTNGASYYYFVTARDLLGRDGLVSDGVLVTICDRMPPPIPRQVNVRPTYSYDSGSKERGFEITWRQNTDTNQNVTGYYVYRARSITNLQANATNLTYNLISSLIPHVPGQTLGSHTDTNITPADIGSTFWYMVRALDDSACGGNISGQSAPAFGAVHDFASAPAPTGVVVEILRENPHVLFVSDDEIVSADPNEHDFVRLICRLTNTPSAIAWVEFAYNPGYDTNSATATQIGPRRYYAINQTQISTDVPYPLGATFFCRVGTENGAVSEYIWHYAERVNKGTYRRIIFEARYNFQLHTVNPDDPTVVVIPDDDPESPDNWQWPTFRFTLPEGVDEYRVYRRVDGGDADLIEQGLSTTNEVDEIVTEDQSAGIAYGATLCYYLQYFDKNGNPGPFTLIDCFEVQGEVPNPLMMNLDADGTTAAPQMDVEWFCSPEGVERFLVWIAVDDENADPVTVDYCTDTGVTSNYPVVLDDGTTNIMDFTVFQTGRVGANFGGVSNPVFSVTANIELGRTYTVFVQAVGTGNALSDDSDTLQFAWHTPTEDTPEVPWPVRELSTVQSSSYHPKFGARYLTAASSIDLAQDKIGIRIGECYGRITGKPSTPTIIYELGDPMTYIYTNTHGKADGDTLFPFVMYRTQVTNSTFRHVSGDVYQVSPLMENIAYIDNTAATNVVVFDPYIQFYREDGSEEIVQLYMLDTQPAVRGATYEYFIMRFDENHEIERIIPAGSVTVPE
jgi:hypothetical protein